jgi:hypothetical protein
VSDLQRVDAVLRALETLARHPEPVCLADGLSAAMATKTLATACGLIGREGLTALGLLEGARPEIVLVVAARGVFTAPLEWVAGLSAIGCRVVLKAPGAAAAFAHALSEAFLAERLFVEVITDHVLPPVDAVVAMGSDATMIAIEQRYPACPKALFGHRFSVAIVSAGADPKGLADDVSMYDGRGCFTPTAIFVLGTSQDAEALATAVALGLEEAERKWPRGELDPEWGPQWRERLGLARALGSVFGGDRYGVAFGPAKLFEASAMPRWVTVHAVSDLSEALTHLEPWRRSWSACATDLGSGARAHLLRSGFERVCAPGDLQRPRFGRPHGGEPFIEGLLGGLAAS